MSANIVKNPDIKQKITGQFNYPVILHILEQF